MKLIRQNIGLIFVIIISLIISYFTSFTISEYTSIYERSKGIYEVLLGLIIVSYTMFISFISELKNKVGDNDVLSQLNYYFLFNILFLVATNLFYVIYPIINITDNYWFRMLYLLTTGFTLLIIWYLFIASKTFISK